MSIGFDAVKHSPSAVELADCILKVSMYNLLVFSCSFGLLICTQDEFKVDVIYGSAGQYISY